MVSVQPLTAAEIAKLSDADLQRYSEADETGKEKIIIEFRQKQSGDDMTGLEVEHQVVTFNVAEFNGASDQGSESVEFNVDEFTNTKLKEGQQSQVVSFDASAFNDASSSVAQDKVTFNATEFANAQVKEEQQLPQGPTEKELAQAREIAELKRQSESQQLQLQEMQRQLQQLQNAKPQGKDVVQDVVGEEPRSFKIDSDKGYFTVDEEDKEEVAQFNQKFTEAVLKSEQDEDLDRMIEQAASTRKLKSSQKRVEKQLHKQVDEAFEVKEKFLKRDNIYLTHKEYRQAKKESGMTNKEFKEHNAEIKGFVYKDKRKKFKDEQAVKQFLRDNNFVDKQGKVDVKALQSYLANYTGMDLTLNYGIHEDHNGGMYQDEFRLLQEATGLSHNQCLVLVRAAGMGDEEHDKNKKTAGQVALAGLAAIPGAGAGFGLGYGAGQLIAKDLMTKVAATSTVTVDFAKQYSLGISKEVGNAIKDLPLQVGHAGAAIGGVLSMATAMITTAILYKYDGKRDLINGGALSEVVKNPDKMFNENKNDKETILAAGVLKSLKDAGVPDRTIEQALRVSMSNASGTGLNLEELLAAVQGLKNMDPNDFLQDKKCHEGEKVVQSVQDDKSKEVVQPIQDDKSKEVVQPVQDDKSKEVIQQDDKVNGAKVTVMNGESFKRIATKYGVDIEQLKEINKSKIHHYKDCNDKIHYFFRVGETITLPDGADAVKVKENQENVKREDEIKKYSKAVWSETNILKLAKDYCYNNNTAQGGVKLDEAVRLKAVKIIEQKLGDSKFDKVQANELKDVYKGLTGEEFKPKKTVEQFVAVTETTPKANKEVKIELPPNWKSNPVVIPAVITKTGTPSVGVWKARLDAAGIKYTPKQLAMLAECKTQAEIEAVFKREFHLDNIILGQ